MLVWIYHCNFEYIFQKLSCVELSRSQWHALLRSTSRCCVTPMSKSWCNQPGEHILLSHLSIHPSISSLHSSGNDIDRSSCTRSKSTFRSFKFFWELAATSIKVAIDSWLLPVSKLPLTRCVIRILYGSLRMYLNVKHKVLWGCQIWHALIFSIFFFFFFLYILTSAPSFLCNSSPFSPQLLSSTVLLYKIICKENFNKWDVFHH